ncbi:hexosaminidase D-like [Bufo bufo]|uniref:hexosaminidase D-like n=1 Tax=Bufo bufo TaxID=8384 RepID=UPI001ABE5912|nr:hexosaminidase D-like [Bufo bufo]XP_040296049.1 hexosaminidase D-like [Bufo bufo]XP_040296050.1 hexosaminidase D-like [Bufo bufo]
MPYQRKIHFLRLGVLVIVALAMIKYIQSGSPPQVTQPVTVEKRSKLFWGAEGEDPVEPVIGDLPPEPQREEEIIPQPKIKTMSGKVTLKDFSGFEMKLVHLDLKGAPPKVSYYEQIFPLLSKLGANGLLIEYEDMFPFTGELAILKSPYAYSEDDLKKILHLAETNNLEVVPLVQTFGHMEYVLKHDKYKALREVDRYPNSLNPHNMETLPLVKMILTQVLQKHPMSSWVHIGSDEVYHLGEGQDSKSWLNGNKGDLGKMFLSHLKNVVSFLHAEFPEKNQLIWDDMLRKLSTKSIRASGITKHVSPVLWLYHGNFNMEQTESFISKYEKSGFTNIWFASAFKGASGPAQMWTPMDLHMKNHQEWKKVINSMSKFPKIHYSGIALTGWQRYDHYSVLCELLPVGIPSLAVCLKTLKYGQFTEEAKKDISHILGFSNINVEKNTCEGTGAFPGAEIYNMVRKIHSDLKKVREITEGDSEISGWFSRYHRVHRFGNPHKMETFSAKILKANEEWESHIHALRSELDSIYFQDTVEEWMEENVNPYMDSLRELAKDFQEILPLNARPKVMVTK